MGLQPASTPVVGRGFGTALVEEGGAAVGVMMSPDARGRLAGRRGGRSPTLVEHSLNDDTVAVLKSYMQLVKLVKKKKEIKP